jgi:predicted TIM-barrel fold metal-dependent hydrolase
MPYLDVSAYVGAWGRWPLKYRTATDVLGLMDRYEVGHAVIGSTRALETDWRKGNEEVLAAAQESAGRLIPFVTVNSATPGAEQLLAGYAERGARGVRCYPSMHHLAAWQLESLCAEAERLGLIVTLVLRPLMDWSLPVAPVGPFEALFRAFPKLQFVVHGLNYGEEFAAAIRLLRTYPNVWVETSCMQGMDATGRVAAQVGVDRLLLGIGLPLQYPACGLAKLTYADLSPAQKTAVAEGNARRLLGMTG